ncbi:hypothetical protein LGH83_09755 [Lichenihabitans sp. PAMC28606]|uniref:hypothetical protein n=1 Tax=Lichenihabitans sp. PAMC28606 TaxID=2880932 RepID=UPI001D09EE2E|nr:hypothetical protein [Lichenihabitans sp. PAMC28606]UDL96432.1 hypothetical protein LGH83_09755 [Lichenihabitans sp. PAMC28606]
MRLTLNLTVASAALALTLVSGAAIAQSRTQLPGQYYDPMNQAPPLTVRKRAFTDSGTQVPVGYENDYMVEQTTLNEPTYSTFRPDQFGQDVLPGRFGGIGN